MSFHKISIVLLIVFITQFAQAQNFKADLKEAVPLVLKALNHNITIKEKMRENCVIAVLYAEGSALSEEEKRIIADVLNDNKNIKVHGEKIKIIDIPVKSGINLEKKIIINKINAFWLASGVQSYIEDIRESARFNQVITVSSDPDLVSQSLVAMGARKTESGYKLIINLLEARNMNIDLNQNLFSEAFVEQPQQD
ncbi:MAG: hypothetical protein JXL67_09565 [Calditrichaeota bacterium]|nr:hypothetical protein [Calditrichota bacterium]